MFQTDKIGFTCLDKEWALCNLFVFEQKVVRFSSNWNHSSRSLTNYEFIVKKAIHVLVFLSEVPDGHSKSVVILDFLTKLGAQEYEQIGFVFNVERSLRIDCYFIFSYSLFLARRDVISCFAGAILHARSAKIFKFRLINFQFGITHPTIRIVRDLKQNII